MTHLSKSSAIRPWLVESVLAQNLDLVLRGLRFFGQGGLAEGITARIVTGGPSSSKITAKDFGSVSRSSPSRLSLSRLSSRQRLRMARHAQDSTSRQKISFRHKLRCLQRRWAQFMFVDMWNNLSYMRGCVFGSDARSPEQSSSCS
jgi:hypothetical protein